MRAILLLSSLLAFAAITPAVQAQSTADDGFIAEPMLTPGDVAPITGHCDRYLARGAELRTALEADTATPSPATLHQYDEIGRVLDAASSDANLIAATSPVAAHRDAARLCLARADAAMGALELSRPLYDRLKAIPLTGADDETRHMLARTLARFDRGGVSRDAATHERIKAINDDISALEIQFAANLANSRNTVTAEPGELDGLPADYIAAHPPGADGKVVLSTDYPDISPVMNYARSDALRQRLYVANLTRAYPGNDAVLQRLLRRRDELAKLLGRTDFATLVYEDQMLSSPAQVRAFIEELARTGDPYARRDYARMLQRLQRDQPAAATLALWDEAYVSQLIKKEQYAVDPQQVRRYFAYDNVRDGILQLTRDLMGVEIRPWKTAVWHPSVEAYEMLDGGKVIGRFYFDTHPRPGKFSHAAVFGIRKGIKDRALPLAALVTNFPAGDHRTGLMEHRDVETFLHEYGHLIHVMMSGGQHYALSSMGNLESDFMEAPSKMLENFVWDYDTLARFAVDSDGDTIPRKLVEKMNEARYFGEALRDRRQLSLANVSMSYHLGPPDPDLTAQYARAYQAYSLQDVPAGVHPQDSLPHLGTSHGSSYYKYMWSQTIALALFARLEAEGVRNPGVARDYREKILAPGGSKPAARLVEDFLGQPPSLDAYRERLGRGH